MNLGTMTINFNAGDTYQYAEPEATEPQKERSRGEARQAAIEQFRKAAQSQTLPQIRQTALQLIGLLIQFKAVGGSMSGDALVDQLREAADFMEDI